MPRVLEAAVGLAACVVIGAALISVFPHRALPPKAGLLAPTGASPDRAVAVLALQRSGSNFLRTMQRTYFSTQEYTPINGSMPFRYCLACMSCTIPGERGLVRGAPGQEHFLVDRTHFRPKGVYSTRCHFPEFDYNVTRIDDLGAIYGQPMTFLVAVKEPVAWLVSVMNFWQLPCANLSEHGCLGKLDMWTSYYAKWLALMRAQRTAPRPGPGASSVSIVRYEDMLHSVEEVMRGLGLTYGWAPSPTKPAHFDVDNLEVRFSRDARYGDKRHTYETRRFLIRDHLLQPGHEEDRLFWFRANCPILRRYFAQTDVHTRLGYDLWYLDHCDPPPWGKVRATFEHGASRAAAPLLVLGALWALAAAGRRRWGWWAWETLPTAAYERLPPGEDGAEDFDEGAL